MKFIKCESCHHFNPIKSEYQIFCDACGKKIPNNFKAWQQKYPNKNLEDYKNTVGATKQTVKPKSKKISLKKILQITFIVVCSLIGAYFGKQQSTKLYSFFHELAFPVSELLNKEWDRQYFSKKQISLESPYLLKEDSSEIPLADEVKAVVVKMNNYTYKENILFSMLLSNIEYNKSVGSVSLKGASDGAIMQAMLQENGKDLFYSDNNTYVNQYPAIIKKGNFTSDGNTVYFKSITCLKNDFEMIFFVAIWIGENENYELLTDRIVQSFDVR